MSLGNTNIRRQTTRIPLVDWAIKEPTKCNPLQEQKGLKLMQCGKDKVQSRPDAKSQVVPPYFQQSQLRNTHVKTGFLNPD